MKIALDILFLLLRQISQGKEMLKPSCCSNLKEEKEKNFWGKMNHLCVPAEEKSMLWVVEKGVPLSFVVYPLSERRFHPQLFSSDLKSIT